jgi:WD40 repeat protein
MKRSFIFWIVLIGALVLPARHIFAQHISGEYAFSIHISEDVLGNVVIPRDSTKVITTSLDGTLKITDILLKQEKFRFPVSLSAAICVPAYNAPCDYLAFYDGTEISVIKVSDQKNIRNISFAETISSLAMSMDGKFLALGSPRGVVQIFDIASGSRGSLLPHFRFPVTTVTFMNDDSTIAVGLDSGRVELWNYVTNNVISSNLNSTQAINCVKLLPGDLRYLTSDVSGHITIRDVRRGREVESLTGTIWNNNAIEIAPDGSGFFYIAHDTLIRFHNKSGEDILELHSPVGRITSLSLSTDAKVLAVGSASGDVFFYHINGIRTIVRKPIINIIPSEYVAAAKAFQSDAFQTKIQTGELRGIVQSDEPIKIFRINELSRSLVILDSLDARRLDSTRIYNYEFRYPFNVRYKSEDIVLEAVNLRDVKTTRSLTLKFEEPDIIPPVISLQNPSDSALQCDFVTSALSPFKLPISGLISDNKGIRSFTINGIPCLLTDPTAEDLKNIESAESIKKFDITVPLHAGANKFGLRAIDINNNASTDTLVIYATDSIPPPPTPHDSLSAQNKPPKIWAVVIGISKFKSKNIDLKYADKDAQYFYDFLLSKAGGEVSKDRIKLLLNGQATRENILDEIHEKLSSVHSNERVIIYIASHGLTGTNGEFNILGSDTDPDRLVSTGVSWQAVENQVSQADGEVVIFADACHSGTASRPGFRGVIATETNALLAEIAKVKKGTALFCASSGTGYSMEGPQWGGHGVFTKFLVDGLKGAADIDNDGKITIGELDGYVSGQVNSATRGKQHPKADGTLPEDVILSIVK